MIVVDASVAIKWIQEEKDRKKAIQLRLDHLNKTNEIIVPSLLYYEIANALVTKSSTSPQLITRGIKVIYDTQLNVSRETEEDVLHASRLAKQHRTTVYDMLYAVVAMRQKCRLITADEKFLEKTRFPFIKLLKDINREEAG